MALISVVAPCFNEAENVVELHERLAKVFDRHPAHSFEIIFIDNASTDNCANVIKDIIRRDNRVRLIVNNRNFGHIRSPCYGILQARGDAVVLIAADLQDPPEVLDDFIKQWEAGFRIVVAVKSGVEESRIVHLIRSAYYRLLSVTSEDQIIEHYTGFGMYDRSVVEILRSLNDPYPYLRGIIANLGFEIARVPFFKPTRKRGVSKSNLYALYDIAMLGITSHSRVPLRLAIFLGFLFGMMSFATGMVYLIRKLLYWNSFTIGEAPTVIGLAMLGSIQLCFIGLLGEYLLAINTRLQNMPMVIERERVNF